MQNNAIRKGKLTKYGVISVIIDSWPDIAFVIAVIDTIEEAAMKKAKKTNPRVTCPPASTDIWASMSTDKSYFFDLWTVDCGPRLPSD